MKTSIASSNGRIAKERNVARDAKVIQCSFCQNTFSAVPRHAVCLKCKRPANKPLSPLNIALCLILFPVGLIKSVLMRSSQPYAASQALLFSVVGALVWAAIYFVLRGFASVVIFGCWR